MSANVPVGVNVCCFRRQDPVSGRWVVIAPGRGGRPHDRSGEEEVVGSAHVPSCPFCEGNESKTPPEVFVHRPAGVAAPDSPGWRFRVVPNLYPALCPAPAGDLPGGVIPSVGAHEVLIHSPRHDHDFSRADAADAGAALDALIRRVRFHFDNGAAWVTAVTNWMREAGASLDHPHSQLFASDWVPSAMHMELTRLDREMESAGGCLQCGDIARAKEQGRVVSEEDGWIVMTPWAPRVPYEVWVLPSEHRQSLLPRSGTPEGEGEAAALARVLSGAIRNSLSLAGINAYNLLFYSYEGGSGRSKMPADGRMMPGFHARIEILPRGPIIAGYELVSGEVICTAPPERTAAHLRGEA